MKKILYLIIYLFLVNISLGFSLDDPLPSWNEGKTKQKLIEFVQKTTNAHDQEYISPDERIATFDQDGTLWVEQPLYTQFVFAIDMIRKQSALHPEWKDKEPYKSILDENIEKIKQMTIQDIEKILAVSYASITVSDYQKNVAEWLKTSKHPRFNRPYTSLVYQPMLELIKYLENHGYKVFIVSGGGQDFIRVYSNQVYGIPPEQVIGSSAETQYEYKSDQPVLTKLPKILLIDDGAGKPEAIHLFIGKKPAAAFGNSEGDKQMLEWSQAFGKNSLQLLVHHDDFEREYAYDVNSRIGTFPNSLKTEALERNWIIVSMKNDWKTIFPDQID